MSLEVVWRNPWVRAAAAVAGVVLLAFLVYALSPVLVPLLFAFAVAYVLNPVVDFFERRRAPRTATILAIAVVGIGLLLAIPVFLIPSIVSEANSFVARAGQTAASGEAAGWWDRLLDWLPAERLVAYLGWAPADTANIDARAILAERIGTYIQENALSILRNIGPHFATAGQRAGTAVAQVFASVGRKTVQVLYYAGNVILFAFVTGYLLRDFHGVVANAKALVPYAYRPRVYDIVQKIDRQIHSFMRGQLLVCLCLGVIYGTGMLLSGAPFAIPIALVGGLASMVPYLGAALTIVPSTALTLLQYGVDWHVGGVLATFVVAQTLEGNLLTPRIVGRQVGLSPVWVILAVMVFANLLGFLGLLVAVPAAAALKVLVVEGVDAYRKSRFFHAGGGEADGGPSPGAAG